MKCWIRKVCLRSKRRQTLKWLFCLRFFRRQNQTQFTHEKTKNKQKQRFVSDVSAFLQGKRIVPFRAWKIMIYCLSSTRNKGSIYFLASTFKKRLGSETNQKRPKKDGGYGRKKEIEMNEELELKGQIPESDTFWFRRLWRTLPRDRFSMPDATALACETCSEPLPPNSHPTRRFCATCRMQRVRLNKKRRLWNASKEPLSAYARTIRAKQF